MDDFVKPLTERLTLSGDHFIDIKRRLNHGEHEDLMARMSVDGSLRPDYRTSVVLAFLCGWSLLNDGTPEPMSLSMSQADRIAAIRALDPDRFEEIYLAIDRHVTADRKARDDKKKAMAGVSASSATSPSPNAADGGTNGSAIST